MNEMLDQGQLPLLLIESAVAVLSYLFGAFVRTPSRASTPWWPMIALVPFAALVSVAVTTTCMLYLFMVTAGGIASLGFAPVVILTAAFLGNKFGAWAVAPRAAKFRTLWAIASFVVFAYLVALVLRTICRLA